MTLTEPFDLVDDGCRGGAVHIERLLQMNRQRVASYGPSPPPDTLPSLGIVGAGVMGTAIAAAAVARGLNVWINDADPRTLQTAEDRIAESSVADYGSTAGACRASEGLEEIAACDIVIEAVVEDEIRKAPLLRELDERMAPGSVLATNTSTIPISRLGRSLKNPGRLCGTHFFLPLPERPVVEVIFADATSGRAREAAIGLAGALGRDVLLAPDAVGFVVNRMMMPYVSEAMQLLTEGVEPELIERVAVAFGMPNGPLSLLDEIGLDTALDCGWIFAGAYEDRVAVSPLLVAMVKAGRLGRKTNAGFFRYTPREDGTQRQEADPAAAEIVARWVRPTAAVTAEEVAARLFLPIVFEGIRMLEEHEACLPADVDLGVVLGLGMAPARGGPLFWCDRVGAQRILEIAEPFMSLGLRMEPPARLRRLAEQEQTFHSY